LGAVVSDLHRELGAHDQAIETLQRQMVEVLRKLECIEAKLNQQQGGMRLLNWIIAASATVGGLVVWLLDKVRS
jgi:hypothetical protein